MSIKKLIQHLNELNEELIVNISQSKKQSYKKPISITDIYSVLNLHPYPKCPVCGEELEFDEYNYLNTQNKYRIVCSCCDYSISDYSWEQVISRFNVDALRIYKHQYHLSGIRYILACFGLNLIFGWVSFPVLLGIYGTCKFLIGPKIVEFLFENQIKKFKQKYPYKTAIEKMNIKEIQCDDDYPNYKEFIKITNNIYNIISCLPINNVVSNFINILIESNRVIDFIKEHPENKSQISHFLNYAYLVEKTANIYKKVLQYPQQDKELITHINNSTGKLLLVYQELYKRLVNNSFDADRATLKVINDLTDEILTKY